MAVGGAVAGNRRPFPALDAAIAEVRKTGAPTEEVAARHGVAARTLRRRLAEKPARATAAKPRRIAKKPARARPVPTPVDERPLEEDTLVTARRLLGKLQRRFESAENSREASGLAEKIIGAIGRVEQILARRPPPPRPDAILEELYRLSIEAIAKIEEHLPDRIDGADVVAAIKSGEARDDELRRFAEKLPAEYADELRRIIGVWSDA